MTILLVRHAKVVINQRKKMTAQEMKEWIKEYNHGFVSHEVPKEKVTNHLKYAKIIIASSLSRTEDSLKLIGLKAKEKNSLFDEIELPEFENNFIKLYPKKWLILYRSMLILRIGDKSKILQASKQRAKMSAIYLDRLAKENDNVALMGHGGMNWLMGKELENLGWKCVEDNMSKENWGYKVYEMEEIK
jgi:broad specificity phosphatase PhoE